MVVQDIAGAQIELILASSDTAQIRQLRHDSTASKIAYFFVHLSNRTALVAAASRAIAANGGRTPLVMVVNYKFAGTDSEIILRAIRATSHAATIECVMTDVPDDDALRQRLGALGARLFDGDSTDMAQQFTFH